MSLRALTWAVENTECPSASAKLVLIVYANFANEHGCCYPSTATVVRMSGLNRKTAIAAIDMLEEVELLVDTGKRTGATGQVKVYRVGMESIPETGLLQREPSEKPRSTPVKGSQAAPSERGPKTGPLKAPNSVGKGSQYRETEPVLGTSTPKEPSGSLPPKGSKRDRGSMISEDWVPCPISQLPDHVRTIAASWPAGAYEAEAKAHRDFWLGDGRPKLDWDRVWEHRIVNAGAKPLRDAKAGVRHASPPVSKASAPAEPLAFSKPGEDPAVAEWRTAAAVTIGPGVYRRLLDGAQLVLDDEQLTIMVHDPVVEQQLAASHLFRLEPLTERILRRRLTRLQVCRRAA